MNISQPLPSRIQSVDFGFLTPEDIRTLSVKRIQNPTTFDSLLHPVPGGLYDAALGAWSDNRCSTCHLNTYSCPGHIGHIELPVPVYHLTFLPQLLLLLRARCAYCGHLKLNKKDAHTFRCKFRLIQHGLLKEVKGLEDYIPPGKGAKVNGVDTQVDGEDKIGEDNTEPEDEDLLEERRETFVRRAIKKAIKQNGGGSSRQNIESISEARRAITKEFFADAPKIRKCGTCNGISPGWRHDKFSKIFRKSLTKTDKAQMIQAGFKAVNPLIRAVKARKNLARQKREGQEIDEGIVVDSDDLVSEEDGEDIEMLEIENEMASNSVMKGSTASKKSKSSTVERGPDEYVTTEEVYATISELFHKEPEMMELVYNHHKSKMGKLVTPDMFFLRTILVPPNKYRPETKTGEGEIAEAQSNTLYKNILQQCETLNLIRKEMLGTAPDSTYRQRDFRDFQNVWVNLQIAVNSMIDSDRSPLRGPAARLKIDGVKQVLEKKEGLFRQNMMGKRVNFAARSVISPDPNIETNEVGVPPVFARKLTYPEPVNHQNFYDLKQAVLNGVEKWPGASAIENESGQVINLRTKNFEERQALANQLLAPSSTNVNGARNKKVHRHLNNGDMVLMNRQPTLHKPSIMAHRCRILPGEKTIRLHYANCNTYNADFDGDEMNMHFPQTEAGRAEALEIANTDNQYLVATSGKPLRGLIQDHISVGVWLTNRDTFFDREDYHQLLCSCLRPEKELQINADRIQTIPPAMVKPRALWTGKQVITTVLKNIRPDSHPGLTMQGKSQTVSDRWGEGSEEGMVIIQDGELLCGILDKAHLGPTGGGFVHSVYEAYGPKVAGKFLSIVGRLLTKFLHMRAFTCGMDDLVLTPEGDKARLEKLKQADTIGLEVASKYVTLDETQQSNDAELRHRLEDVQRDDQKQAGLDNVYSTRTSQLSTEITSVCLPVGLVKPFPRNQMQAMTTSGAKGSAVNANLISCNLGQQVLEGRRVPVMVSGKSLPSFKAFETKVRAGGYITDRFLTGVKPQEYYFHAMAGREGLIDTAVKTSRSGYLQRCLVKGMEGIKSEYDSSVRDSDGSMVQFLYGEDGLDVTKQKYLTNFRFLAENHLSFLAQLNLLAEYSILMGMDTGATEHNKLALRKYKKTGQLDCMDPALALFNPGSALGSTSESFASAVKAYCDQNPERLLKDKQKAPQAVLSKKTFMAMLDAKYLKSTMEPGEAVGVVAAQSIGEPSTQMTLNTFHLAGHAARNVTAGIPRLREIVMTASKKISTPAMTLHLIPELTEEAGERFAKGITKLSLAEVIEEVHVSESIGPGVGYAKAKIYKVRLDLFPAAEYCSTYAINVGDVLRILELRFVPQLAKAIKKELSRKGNAKLLKESAAQPEVGKSSGVVAEHHGKPEAEYEGGEDDEDDGDDEDATNNKQRQNRNEDVGYDEPDDEEAAIIKEAERQVRLEAGELSDEEGDDDENGNGSDDEEALRKATAKDGEARIKAQSPSVSKFTFDAEAAQWCEIRFEYDVATAKLLLLPLVEAACHAAIIQSIPSLGACTYTKLESRDPATNEMVKAPAVLTQGVNLQAMHDYQDIINPHRIVTNDIWAMRCVYGIEACRATIVREMDAVFKGHSITVDLRHLNLIADFMTKGGDFRAFNRTGMKDAVSPFAKMSFETTLQFVKDAVLEGEWDDLVNPSARLVVGGVAKVGTGCFDVMNRLEVGMGDGE